VNLPADRLVLFGRLCLIAVVLTAALAVIFTPPSHRARQADQNGDISVTLPHRIPGESGLRPIVLPIATLASLLTHPQKGTAMLTPEPDDPADDQTDAPEQEQDQPESEPHVANPF
jgi:hypothetical protein